MSRRYSSSQAEQQVIVLDNGGATCKIGSAGQQGPPQVFPNATGRVKGERQQFVADQLLHRPDIAALTLRRPLDRGYVVAWDVERTVWQRAFEACVRCRPQQSGLLLSEPLFTLPATRDTSLQVVFEEFGFASCLTQPPQLLSLRQWAQEQPSLPANQAFTGVVLDSGFSFTHAVPIFDGQVLEDGVRRLNLGGKAMTNFLKELISYRSINVMEETFAVEQAKEAASYVSQDLAADLAKAKAGKNRLEFVLPDGVENVRGILREPVPKAKGPRQAPGGPKEPQETSVLLANERFMVPELLFNPTDVGLDQGGVAQLIVEAASGVHEDLRPLLLSNVLCTGGNATIPGFKQRLESELRPLVPDDYEVAVHLPQDPILAAWQGGSSLGASPEYATLAMTKAEYDERGAAYRQGAAFHI